MELILEPSSWVARDLGQLLERVLSVKNGSRTSLVVQWLRLCTPTSGGANSTPGWGTKILRQKKKKEQFKLAKQPDIGLLGALVYCENSNVSTWIWRR